MTQDEIRAYWGANKSVHIQIASSQDGSPEVGWGDTFFFVLVNGQPKKMPFVTIVTKDYYGYDSDSKLNRGGLFRLNIDVGKEKFEELFGFKTKDHAQHLNEFDFTETNQLFRILRMA